jgi:NAD(P)-dependent dehydrogenase (short-subunit alcohol dehydrogenase family)
MIFEIALVIHGWPAPLQAVLPAPPALSILGSMELRGASCLVTGAGRGIGRAIALRLSREGGRVTAVARTGSELDSLVREASGSPGSVRACVGDVRDPTLCAEAVRGAVEAHGRLQVLVTTPASATSRRSRR